MRPPVSASSVPAWCQLLLAFGLVLAATLHASWSTLDRYFIGDDFGYVGRFAHLPFREWPSLLVNDWSGGIWGYQLPELRPFVALTFLVDARCWGANPLGYHLTNLVLDTGCACLVGLIVWRLHSAALWFGCAAGILFAWHPAHAEPVAWITGRVDLLGTLAYLAGFFAGGRYLQSAGQTRWLIAAWLAYGVGCFSKEFCLTLPVALLLWWWFYRPAPAPGRRRQLVLLFGGLVVVAGVFLYCRRIAFGPGAGGVAALNLLSPAYAERQMDYLRWFLTPLYHFGRDYRPQLAAIAPALVTGALLLSLGLLAVWRGRGPATDRWRAVAFYGFTWYAVATLPLAVASYFAPRHLYFATAGLAIATGLFASTFLTRRGVVWALVTLAALFSVDRFHHAVTPWRHAAKVSEAVTQSAGQIRGRIRPGEVLLVDVPSVYEGVWMWSWASPFALQPPFLPPLSNPVLTRPSVHFAPHLWATQPVLATLANAPGAWLIRVDERGKSTLEHITPGQFQAPARRLERATADPETAWNEFVSSLVAR